MTCSEDVAQRLQYIKANPDFWDWLVESGWIEGSYQEIESALCAWKAAREKYKK